MAIHLDEEEQEESYEIRTNWKFISPRFYEIEKDYIKKWFSWHRKKPNSEEIEHVYLCDWKIKIKEFLDKKFPKDGYTTQNFNKIVEQLKLGDNGGS